MSENNELVIGKLTKPHGLHGEVRFYYYGNEPESLHQLKHARVVKDNSDVIDLEVLSVRGRKNPLILKFSSIDSISKAEELIGAELRVNRSALSNLDDDEYYWEDLIGLLVYSDSGDLVGTLKSIMETGSNDVYVVKRGKKEILIPAINDVIKEVDIEKGTMHIHILEGMIDDI